MRAGYVELLACKISYQTSGCGLSKFESTLHKESDQPWSATVKQKTFFLYKVKANFVFAHYIHPNAHFFLVCILWISR